MSIFIELFIVAPHADYFDYTRFLNDLINQTMLDVDSARIGAFQIAKEFLIGRRRLIRIVGKDAKQRLRLGF